MRQEDKRAARLHASLPSVFFCLNILMLIVTLEDALVPELGMAVDCGPLQSTLKYGLPMTANKLDFAMSRSSPASSGRIRNSWTWCI